MADPLLRPPVVAALIASTFLALLQGGVALGAAAITATKSDAFLNDADERLSC
jgi:hypothetical protein